MATAAISPSTLSFGHIHFEVLRKYVLRKTIEKSDRLHRKYIHWETLSSGVRTEKMKTEKTKTFFSVDGAFTSMMVNKFK